ncbi:MAG: protein kinase [Melioribacteraceae bacterium]|nr:protein kinase [Melioribacteraceae bacterium]
MEDLIGKKIENYLITSVLGRGGMGVVYKARDEKLDRYVAIKVLAVKAVDKERFIERFKREAKNHAQLSHPNIVTVYGFIEYEGLLGIVMEYVEGESLEKVLFKQNRLHVFDVVYIIRQVLLAIGYAHSKGFVHRDIKPSNIIINHEGTVKIMDFGISKSIVEKGMTRTGSKVGTVLYMSPEQIKGESTDHLTDIYAIGCTMYEMITGKPPFYSDSEYEIMDGHLKKNPVKVSVATPGIPAVLEEIVLTSLSKNPSDRYQRCEDILVLLGELDEYMKDVKSKYFLRTQKDPKKTKALSTFAFSAFIVIMAALFYFVYVQVGELLQSDVLDNFKKYSVQSIFSSGDTELEFSEVYDISTNSVQNLHSLYFTDDSFGVVVGDSGTVLVTSDSGSTWEYLDLSTKYNLRDIVINNNHLFIVGDGSRLYIYSLSDITLNTESFAGGNNFYAIQFKDKMNAFILGSRGTLNVTKDGGKSWKEVFSQTDKTLYDIIFTRSGRGFIVGWGGTIISSEDSGMSWERIKEITGKYLRAVDFWGEDIGLIVGGAGTILRTSDGGSNWVELENNSSTTYNDVKFLNQKIAIIVGARGTILITLDGGISFKEIETNNYANLNKISISDSGNIYISGVNGTVLKINVINRE